MSTLGIDLLTGGPIGSGNGDPNNGTVLDPSVTIGSHSYTDAVTPTLSQQNSGIFTNVSFTIPASALTSNSGALYLELVDTGNANQVNFSNIEISDTLAVPEPGTWAMLLGGLGTLFFFQRMRRGYKV